MITTEEALSIVNKYIIGFQSDIADKQKLISALQVVADGLSGILDTPTQDILSKNEQIATLTESKTTLEAQVATLAKEKATLEAQVAELTVEETPTETPVENSVV